MLLFVKKRDFPEAVLKKRSGFKLLNFSSQDIEELGQKSVVNSF